jgi:hypothetical protein
MRRVTITLVVAIAVAALGGCSSPAWPKTAADTTCSEWSSQMSEAQRQALGTAILLALRADDGGTIIPPDAMLKAFVTAIGDTCKQNPDAKISTVGATLYNLSKDLQP